MSWRDRLLAPLCLVLFCVLAWHNALDGAFVYDDAAIAVNNDGIRSLSPLTKFLDPRYEKAAGYLELATKHRPGDARVQASLAAANEKALADFVPGLKRSFPGLDTKWSQLAGLRYEVTDAGIIPSVGYPGSASAVSALKPEERQALEALAARSGARSAKPPEFPKTFGESYTVRFGAGEGAPAVEVRPITSARSQAVVRDGVIMYCDSYKDTSVFYTASATEIEEFYLLKSSDAPKTFVSELRPQAGIGSFRVNENGALEALDEGGRKLLVLSRPVVIDAKGRRVEGTFRLVQEHRMKRRSEAPKNLAPGPRILDRSGHKPIPKFSVAGFPTPVKKKFKPEDSGVEPGASRRPARYRLAPRTAGVQPSGLQAQLSRPYIRASGREVPYGDAAGTVLLALSFDDAGLEYPVLIDPTWTVPADNTLTDPRFNHVAILLPNGKVIVTGGSNAGGARSTVELYDPANGTWTYAASMNMARGSPAAVLLPNGKVLVAGGADGLSSAELYDPEADTWTYTDNNMLSPRRNFTVTLLPDGRVLAVGGYNGSKVSTSEIYDPSAGTNGTWGTSSNLFYGGRAEHATVLLPTGKVLVAGGDFTATVELYDPNLNSWTSTVSMNIARGNLTVTLFSNGKVLAVGGSYNGFASVATSETYDPYNPGWAYTSNSMANKRHDHSATLLPDGKLLVTGGRDAGPSTHTNASAVYDPVTDLWSASGSMSVTRSYHSATLLPSGQVLIAGGIANGPLYRTETDLYDPSMGQWKSVGSLPVPVHSHTSTLLPNGKVLVVGGSEWGVGSKSAAALYEPGTGLWTPTTPMSDTRNGHSATLLPDGRVLIAGGDSLSTAVIYNPADETWAQTGDMNEGRSNHLAVLLRSGKVLIAGGGPGHKSTAEIYDPLSRTWEVVGSMAQGRGDEGLSAVLLLDGRVLVAGGVTVGTTFISTAEIYDPDTGTWNATGSLAAIRGRHTTSLLPDGRVIVVGGHGPGHLNTAEIYDPGTGLWSPTGPLSSGRSLHSSVLLPNGQVLVAGGESGTCSTHGGAEEVYDPATGLWKVVSNAGARERASITLLPNGEVLFSGGHTGCGTSLSTSEVALFTEYDFNLSTKAFAQPSIAAIGGQGIFPVTLGPGSIYTVTGTTFTGRSEGAGGTPGSPTNYPRVILQSHNSGRFMASSHLLDLSASVYGAAEESYYQNYQSSDTLDFYLSSSVACGYYGLSIMANAIPSTFTAVRVVPSSPSVTPGPALALFPDIGVSSITTEVTPTGELSTQGYLFQASTATDFSGGNSPYGFSIASNHSTGTVYGLTANTTYYVRAAAENCGGMSAWSGSLGSTATLAVEPLTAVSTFPTVYTTSMTVQWDAASNPLAVTTYTVYLSTVSDFSGGGSDVWITTAPASRPAATVTGLLGNSTYYLQVRAVNHNGIPTDFVAMGSTITLITAPTDIYFDEISSTTIVASAYAPTPAFMNLHAGQSGTNVYGNGAWAGWHGSTWTTKAPMNTPRDRYGLAACAGRMFAFGGFFSITSNEEYDPAANNWTNRTSMTTGRHILGAACADGRVFAIGGYNGTHLKVNESYDPDKDKWSFWADMLTARIYVPAAGLDGKIYVAGSQDPTTQSDTVEAYDPRSDSWDPKASLNTGRAYHGLVGVRGKVYAVGGTRTGGQNLDSMEEYDPAGDSWAFKTPMPTARAHVGATALGGKIYVFGGYAGAANFTVTEEYDPLSDVWAARAPMPTARRELAAAALRGKIYAVGGYNGTTLALNEEFDPGVAAVFEDLTPNTLYSFKAKARNSVGTETSESVTVSTYTLAATPGTENYSDVIRTTLRANWSVNSNPTGTRYLVEISSGNFPNSFSGNQTSTTLNSFADFGGLAHETTYYSRVGAINNDDIPTAFVSLESTVTLPTVSITIISAETVDDDANGRIDAYRITFSTNLVDTSIVASQGDAPPGFAVGGSAGGLVFYSTGLPNHPDASDDEVIYVRFPESGTPDTNTTPELTYDHAAGPLLQGADGGEVVTLTPPDLTEIDRAPPAMIDAFASDTSGGGAGIQAGDEVQIIFSEDTNEPTINASNINIVLAIANAGQTWGAAINSAEWIALDVLKVALKTAGAPDLVVGVTTITTRSDTSPTITDSAGNISSGTILLAGSFDTGDAAPPRLSLIETQDRNFDGHLDAVKLTFTEPIKDSSMTASVTAGRWNITGAGALIYDTDAFTDDAVGFLVFTDGVLVSSATPKLSYTRGAPGAQDNVVDLASPANELLPGTNLSSSDKAPPVLLSATATDNALLVPGVDEDDSIQLVFSEQTNRPIIDSSNIGTFFSIIPSTRNWGTVNASWESYTRLKISFSCPGSPCASSLAAGDSVAVQGYLIRDFANEGASTNAATGTVVLGGSFVGVDGTSPTITSFLPADTAADAPVSTHVVIGFSERMDKAKAGASLSVAGVLNARGESISVLQNGTTSFDAAAQRLTLTLDSSLENGFTYRATVSTHATDTIGNHLEAEKVFHFTAIASTGTTMVFGSTGAKINVRIPPGALDSAFYVIISTNPKSPSSKVYDKILRAGAKLGRDKNPFSFELPDTTKEINLFDGAGAPITGPLKSPARITLSYADSNPDDGTVDGTNPPVREENIIMFWLDEVHNLWVKLPGSTVDKTANTVAASVSHFSVFTLIGAANTDLNAAHPFPVPFKPGRGDTGITFTNLSPQATIKIYTPSGRLVRTLEHTSGGPQAIWDATNDDGQPAASGAYLYLITNETYEKKGKLIIIR